MPGANGVSYQVQHFFSGALFEGSGMKNLLTVTVRRLTMRLMPGSVRVSDDRRKYIGLNCGNDRIMRKETV